MAKKSKVVRNEQRREIVVRFADRRRELKAIMTNPRSSDAERVSAQAELNRQPRDASATRLRNRGVADGRPRGHLRTFGLSRVTFREMAHRGELPGVTKSSW
ncbi:MAG: 30S ribosomal protein S14 [Angustibacter sp.]